MVKDEWKLVHFLFCIQLSTLMEACNIVRARLVNIVVFFLWRTHLVSREIYSIETRKQHAHTTTGNLKMFHVGVCGRDSQPWTGCVVRGWRGWGGDRGGERCRYGSFSECILWGLVQDTENGRSWVFHVKFSEITVVFITIDSVPHTHTYTACTYIDFQGVEYTKWLTNG